MLQLSAQLNPMENQLWTRSKGLMGGGPLPVQRPPVGRRGPWVVGGVSYPSWSAAMRALKLADRVVRPSRYFGQSQGAVGCVPVWEVLAAVTVTVSQSPVSQVPLGIDLHKRGHEVRKLMYAGFGLRIARSGYDPEEVLQEVYRGILVRNEGKCPFDVRKSSFGHYVHMVIECVLNNYHRKEQRKRHHEVPTDTMRPEVRMGAQGDGLGMMERVVRQNVTDVDVLGVWEAMKGGRYSWREAGVDKKVWLKGVAVLQRIFAR